MPASGRGLEEPAATLCRPAQTAPLNPLIDQQEGLVRVCEVGKDGSVLVVSRCMFPAKCLPHCSKGLHRWYTVLQVGRSKVHVAAVEDIGRLLRWAPVVLVSGHHATASDASHAGGHVHITRTFCRGVGTGLGTPSPQVGSGAVQAMPLKVTVMPPSS